MIYYENGNTIHIYRPCRHTVGKAINLDVSIGPLKFTGAYLDCEYLRERICGTCLRKLHSRLRGEKMKVLWESGKTLQQIGDQHNMSRQAVWQFINAIA